MTRRSFLRSAATLIGLSTAAGTATVVRRGSNRYYDGPVSDHFDGLRFFNPDGRPPKGLSDVLRWRMGDAPAKWPESLPVTPARPRARVADLTVTMVGHATLLVQIEGLNILTDPFWSDRASPVRFAGPKRVTAPGIAFADLPPVDLVLLSHCHYDHMDLATLRRLKAQHDPMVITPLGNDTIIAGTGLRTQTQDWGQSTRFGPLGVHCVPCHHWGARGVNDRSMALWAAFVLTGRRGSVLFVGDTGFDQGRPYRDLADRFGRLRAALLPIGAYDPQWFMADQHQNPDEAVTGFRLSGAAYGIGHHWGTIQLTNEGRNAPRARLLAALEQQSVSSDRFRALEAGEVWEIPQI
ncbi:MBL fold metallo-hydrolase [Mesobacterium sp. TK19101]|uniref:MBL fold metallo-hydrolase n=1 Tax=Mesobacterium hydrothermale TaxID=3111907 RepID=A0ABU6HDV2_9RHOB|nr:MBL fold metallo-hydrolase [Mesobacterium sp. TK19101]MEC3860471.1 MBL fold metallo-hydrolase [Mesobacterium sp. TK19101]